MEKNIFLVCACLLHVSCNDDDRREGGGYTRTVVCWRKTRQLIWFFTTTNTQRQYVHISHRKDTFIFSVREKLMHVIRGRNIKMCKECGKWAWEVNLTDYGILYHVWHCTRISILFVVSFRLCVYECLFVFFV